jgi:hypothetical protein
MIKSNRISIEIMIKQLGHKNADISNKYITLLNIREQPIRTIERNKTPRLFPFYK